eukprot:TRINITY_DN21765_c0_g1_i1.p1 TRINITY_DN21765_c0_g1~~TRINITY_DN21765_c0_g1_i1.p1  ORF type:complete len:842 (+),score=98.49 TRINITY_DN21765_c0_g1_i1:100-2625(+)
MTNTSMGSPARTIRHQTPRVAVGSPLSILADAKEFLASSPELPPRMRPCLDPYRTPFGANAAVSGTPRAGGGAAPGVRPGSVDSFCGDSGGTPVVDSRGSLPGIPRRLPSLSVEDFNAMKRRDGSESRTRLVSQSLEPVADWRDGLESRSSEPGGRSSRNGSRSKRRHQHGGGHESGAKSAPASRGTEDGMPMSPLWPLEAPLTDLEPSRSGFSPFKQRPGADQTPTRCNSMAVLQQGSSRKPPHLPKRPTASSQDRGRDSPFSLMATPLMVEDFSPTGATPLTRKVVSSARSSSPSLGVSRAGSGKSDFSSGYPMVPELPLKNARNLSSDAVLVGSPTIGSGSRRSMRASPAAQEQAWNGTPLAAPRDRDLAPRELVGALASAAESARGRTEREVNAATSDASRSVAEATRSLEGGGTAELVAISSVVVGTGGGAAEPAAHAPAPVVVGTGPTSSSSRPRGTKQQGSAPSVAPVRKGLEVTDAEAAALLAEISNDCAEGSYGWDRDCDDSEQMSIAGNGKVLSNLSCTRGPRGVTGLSVTASTLCGDLAKARTSFHEDPASPKAVKGSNGGPAWVRGETIGHGSLGSVFLALNQTTGQIFAVKEVRIDLKDKSDVNFKQGLENEISICKDLHHPRIVSYMGHDTIDGSLYIYLEYMPGGSITQILCQFGALDESLIATYTRDVLQGLDYLHTRQPKVLHRDIKGANILVGLESRVKLSDFGCSKRTADTLSQSLRGSIPWMAPEVIQQTGYGRRSDVWSLGCVVIEMATAKHPWGQFDNPMAAMVKIGMSKEIPPTPKTVSETCQNFIGRCTQRDKNLRPTADELLLDEFVANVTDDDQL